MLSKKLCVIDWLPKSTQFDSNKQGPEDKMEDVDKKIANSCELF